MNSNRHSPLSQPLDLRAGPAVAKSSGQSCDDRRAWPTRKGCRPTELETLYRRWSQGGVGLLITGNVQIDRKHLERPGNVIIDRDLSTRTSRIDSRLGVPPRSHRVVTFGCRSHTPAGKRSVSSIHIPRLLRQYDCDSPEDSLVNPVALTDSEIVELIDRYALAAKVAKETGFNGVQIHAAHGYLLSQFLAPDANQREDRWGGSLENRARMLLEVVRKVRAAVGSMTLWLR